jgi:hypothetical protein
MSPSGDMPGVEATDLGIDKASAVLPDDRERPGVVLRRISRFGAGWRRPFDRIVRGPIPRSSRRSQPVATPPPSHHRAVHRSGPPRPLP